MCEFCLVYMKWFPGPFQFSFYADKMQIVGAHCVSSLKWSYLTDRYETSPSYSTDDELFRKIYFISMLDIINLQISLNLLLE